MDKCRDNKEGMARKLILDCERRDRIDDLVKTIQPLINNSGIQVKRLPGAPQELP